MTYFDRPLTLHERQALRQAAMQHAHALRDAALDAAWAALLRRLRRGYFSLKASLAPRPAKAAAKPTLSHR